MKVHKTTFTQKQKLVEEQTTQDWIVQGAEKQAIKVIYRKAINFQ